MDLGWHNLFFTVYLFFDRLTALEGKWEGVVGLLAVPDVPGWRLKDWNAWRHFLQMPTAIACTRGRNVSSLRTVSCQREHAVGFTGRFPSPDIIKKVKMNYLSHKIGTVLIRYECDMLLGRQGIKCDAYGGKWPKLTQDSQASLKRFFYKCANSLWDIPADSRDVKTWQMSCTSLET